MVTKFKARRLLAFCIFSAVSTSSSCAADDVYAVRLGNRCYVIPTSYLLPNSYFAGLPNADSSVPEMRLQLKISEIGIHTSPSPEDGARDTNYLEVGVSLPTVENIKAAHSGESYRDLWTGSGDYSDSQLGRSVQLDSDTMLYRVSFRDIPSSWVFVDIDPAVIRNTLPEANRVIGHCRTSPSGYRCVHTAFKEDEAIQYWIGQEISKFETIDKFVFRKLEDWRKESCS